LVRPTDESLDLVEDWLSENGIDSLELDYSPAKDFITVTVPVEHVERLLDTEYSIYQHEDGAYLVRTPGWSLPTHLHEHIDTIQPTTSWFRAKANAVLARPVDNVAPEDLTRLLDEEQLASANGPPSVDQVCNTTLVTPLCLRTLYGTVDYKPQVPGKNIVALNNFLNETQNRSDFNIFLQDFRPDAKGFTFPNIIINNGPNQQTPNTPAENAAGHDVEGNLDVQTIVGITFPTPLFAYNTGGSPPFIPSASTPTNTNEPYLTWLQFILAQKELPQVISSSYADDEQTVPESFAQSACRGFAQLGARGVSLFFGSGDQGVGADGTCISNDGKNTTKFLPLFPASCPFVTTIGATKNFNPEVVAFDPDNGFVTGGGFSNYFPRPSFQDPIVPNYLKSLGNEFKGLYNPNGRAYPDISAQGQRFAVVWGGQVVAVDGTSASTPTVASIFSLVNDALIAAGKPPLGFLNPWLYQHAGSFPGAFNDITSGSAIGCNTTGFPAEKGWDAVTGFGTPVSV
jgi:tripeptidyl-peptidase I